MRIDEKDLVVAVQEAMKIVLTGLGGHKKTDPDYRTYWEEAVRITLREIQEKIGELG